MSDPVRRRRAAILGGVVVVAIAVAVLAIALGGGDDEKKPDGGGGAKTSIFAGIPQDGEWLGSPDAPVVVEEFADLQCPFCREYATDVLPTLVKEYVKPGTVRMRLRLLAFLGPDSRRGAQAAALASLQDKMWDFAEDFYVNQGTENTGYADDAFLVARMKAAGLDRAKVLAQRDDPRVASLPAKVSADAEKHKVDSTPSFLVGSRGGGLKPLVVQSLDVASFRAGLDAALKAAG